VKLTVHVDGGSRGNPGPAAIAAVLSDQNREVVYSAGELIGRATNNVAEYRALIFGIEQAKLLGATELDLVGDSELIVKQIRGEYKVKDPNMKPLHAAAHAALAGLDQWSIRHVKREYNAEADRIVNEALDADD
jgi:ribonuclease HI